MAKGPSTKQTNTYTQITPNPTVATTNLQNMVQQGSDPSIPYHYAQRRRDVADSYQNPLGAYTSPAVRDAANRVTGQRLAMDESEAMKASNYLQGQAAFDRQATVAGFTQPHILSSGGTATTNPGWGQLVSTGAQIGVGLL